MDATGRGSFDATGRGYVVNPPVAAPNQAVINMQSTRPQGGLDNYLVNASPSFLGGPNQVAEEETQNENYLAALFNGETLTEAFKEKAKLIFESALDAKVKQIEEALVESSFEVVKEEIEAGVKAGSEANMETLTEVVDQYLTYVGQEWLQENKIEIESGLRTEIAENFMNGLKELFENSFMEVPEEKVDLVDDLFEEKEKLEQTLNQAIEENLQLKTNLVTQMCIEQFVNVSKGLTDTEIEKLATLVENVDFTTIEQYRDKVQLLKDSYFGNGSQTNIIQDTLDNPQGNVTNTSSPSPIMENYVQTISRQLKLTNIKK